MKRRVSFAAILTALALLTGCAQTPSRTVSEPPLDGDGTVNSAAETTEAETEEEIETVPETTESNGGAGLQPV